ncbi:MAG: amino acid adenylation domain-containing protein [Saprospiraceae bacterium]|nr:amino acid adenylation domain-containing protein [Saprospiraceae bacterium]
MQRLHEILANSAERFPANSAITDPNGLELTYAELADSCTNLCIHLKNHGLAKGRRIGILIPKSAESVIAILSTLSIESAYIPSDAEAPASRNAFIFEDCQASAILISDALLAPFQEAFPHITKQIPLEELSLHLLLCEYENAPDLTVPDDLAYMLYTSGSTGKPKGVLITHQNALSFVDWCLECFPTNETDVFSSIAPFHFDLSIYDLFVGLKSGASIVLFDQKASKNPLLLSSLIGEHKISVLYATPTLLRLIRSYGRIERYDHSALRIVHFAGEVFPVAPLRELKEQWPQAKFFNLYGPTETNVVTWHPIPDQIAPDQLEPFPIGKSCTHVQCKLWEDEIIEPHPGLSGELIVAGLSVAAGYLNLPDRTAQSFFQDSEGQTWYKTGDLVQVNEAGDFVYSGRRDRMVKRRGYRIELGEIEAALSRHSAIVEAGAISLLNASEEVVVYAYLSTTNPKELPNGQELKAFCLNYLPIYMLPDKFLFLEALPKTSTHKIDYQALKKMADV